MNYMLKFEGGGEVALDLSGISTLYVNADLKRSLLA